MLMMFARAVGALGLAIACVAPSEAQTLKIASPQRGSWEGAIPELGKQAGIFKKHGLGLDIVYTSNDVETFQAVISGGVDIGLSAQVMASFGAFVRGAPIRVIGASSTGSHELFWFNKSSSSVTRMQDAHGKTISYSSAGSLSHIATLRFISEYALKGAKAVASGGVSSTNTQIMSDQIDIGWSIAPFNLEPLRKGEIRLLAKGSDIARIRDQTTRVQIVNLGALAAKKDAIKRYLTAYRETLEWMYASPDAIKRYVEFSGLPEVSVREMMKDFIIKDSLQIDRIAGIPESIQDAIQFKYISKPLSDKQLANLIQIDALKYVAAVPPPTAPPAALPPASKASSGTAFRIANGQFITNHHVINGCNWLTVDGKMGGRLLASDQTRDLALVSIANDSGPIASVRTTRIQLNESITAAGFPLEGAFSGIAITNGTISRLSGLRGDTGEVQISAPVQPGNSGGPLLDTAGNVIGVVSSKLNALKVAGASGDIPQNVNFAINGSSLRAFLDAKNINYKEVGNERELTGVQIAARASAFTVLIKCQR
jgi:NitT/TauT family transport system substrate-binding protein